MNTIIAVSGGFDPVHVGHIAMLEEASKHGDLVVILNSDDWLVRKKGYLVMPHKDRAIIMRSIRYVTRVTHVDDRDDTVCEALWRIKPNYFANGGDRYPGNPREHQLCAELGIKELFNIGGGKIRSSSELIKNINGVKS